MRRLAGSGDVLSPSAAGRYLLIWCGRRIDEQELACNGWVMLRLLYETLVSVGFIIPRCNENERGVTTSAFRCFLLRGNAIANSGISGGLQCT